MTAPDAGRPSIGNLLGFSLMLREHRALLALERRTLAAGVHLIDYEATVPGVRFPLEGPLSAAGFRHRRCQVQCMTLEIERHALQAWLDARLRGCVIDGLHVDTVSFDPAARATAEGRAAPWLSLGGHTRDGAFAWLGCALGLRAHGRRVTLWPTHRWVFGRERLDTLSLWLQLARALDPGRRGADPAVGIDPAAEALRVPFVRAGWKIPALEQLALVELVVDDRRARASWRSGAQALPDEPHEDVIDVVPGLAERVRVALAAGDLDRACDEIDALAAATAALPEAQAAVLRWGCEITARQRPRRAGFARAWQRLQPTARAARRALVAALADASDRDELLRHVRVWGQLAESPAAKVRCTLALAHGLAAQGQFAAAREQLQPLRDGEVLADAVRAAWPAMLLDDPPAAVAAQREALAERPAPTRVAVWCDLALTLLGRGAAPAAWQALAEATGSGPESEWLATAVALLDTAGADDPRVRWLDELATAASSASLHARLAEHAERHGQREQALRHWLAAAAAAAEPARRIAAHRAWLAVAEAVPHDLPGIRACAARPEVVAVYQRLLADADDDLTALLVLAEHAVARADDERAAMLDDRALALGIADGRTVAARLRMAARARADGDGEHADELLASLDPASLAPGDRAAYDVLTRPHDAASWIERIDRAFANGDFAGAVTDVREMLQHVPMGADAFAAMAARGVDAALAQGDIDGAIDFVDAVAARAPDRQGLSGRRDELLAVARDPELRARLLAGIAQRHGGAARIEALDLRARVLVDDLGRIDDATAALATAFSEAPDRTDLAARLAELYAARERWIELVGLLRHLFPRQRGAARRATLRWLAAVLRDHIGDLARAEQSLRLAIDTLEPGDDDEGLHDELEALLEREGRWVDLVYELGQRLAPELAGTAVTPRLALLGRLARLQRDALDDEEAAARTYERLEHYGALPDEGLACLARAYRRAARHEDLVRVLDTRARALVGDARRFAAARLHAAELLDGPLARPIDAIDRYLDAFLADPPGGESARQRLRVLLAGVVTVDGARTLLRARAEAATPIQRAAACTLLADVLSHHREHAVEAAACYREALGVTPEDAAANEGLARLELRRGELDAAWPHLERAVRHPALSPTARADLAAAGARALARADRHADAAALLDAALQFAPDHVPALLELARLHERAHRSDAFAAVLEHLRGLPMSGAMRAEVLHRHALSLQPAYRATVRGEASERALADVLEALQADPTHPGARQVLLEIARLRDDWSLVVPALEAVLRTLGPGPARARIELEIAELCLGGADDHEAAATRLERAITEIDDDDVHARASALAMRLPAPARLAERLLAASERHTRALDPEARARLDRLVARLRELGPGQHPVTSDDAAAECLRLERDAARQRPEHAATAWLQAAAAAWARLGDAERAATSALHALAGDPDDRECARVLGDVALSCSEATIAGIHAQLAALDDARLGPQLRLQRATLARLLGRASEALADLTRLSTDDDRAVRRRALAELDQMLEVAAPAERLGVLRARLAELSGDDETEFADVAAELARLELGLGETARALTTCRAGLRAQPMHRTLLRLHVELLERHELPDALVDALAAYASVCASPRERARHLVRAARLVLDRGAAATAAVDREQAAARAAGLLARAREADDDDVPSRALALPLAFAAQRWHEVEPLQQWLWSHGQRNEPALVLAALYEPWRHGTLELAAALGARDAAELPRLVLPGLRQVVSEIATSGPLEHLDAVLAAAARLAGGPLALFDALRRWAMDRPLQSGLALALARLHEAHGDAALARRLVQLAAFLSPGGAVERWLSPPPGREPSDAEPEGGEFDGHAAIRAALRAAVVQRTDAWTNAVPSDVAMPDDERRFREMLAHLGRFTGIAAALAGDDTELADRLDALAAVANPEHRATGARAQAFADALLRQHVSLPVATRVAALDEIAHWVSSPELLARLRVELTRFWWLQATRASEELRGALRTLAESIGTRHGDDIDAAATLRSAEATWLLRALDLYGSDRQRDA